ncbi:MAG: prepilin peptidase [Pseudomonadota bacterium]|nr:prepilin peptidase [Pseudomonadota bacterium]
MNLVAQFSLALFALLMVAAATSDALTYRIPNWLTGLIALSFPAAALAAGMPVDHLLWHVIAGSVLLALGFALFAAGLFGGGDAKLMAAAALWLGWSQELQFLVFTALAGGVLAVAYLAWSFVQVHIELGGKGEDVPFMRRLLSLKPDLPYGIALAIGACATLPQTWWAASLL